MLAWREARDAVETVLTGLSASSDETAAMLRIALLNYVAAAVTLPYVPFLEAARAMRYDVTALSARFDASFEQCCHRLSTLQREGARGVPFFFLSVDPAGNVSKRFSAAGFPFARGGGSCPRWIPHAAFATPGRVVVQVAELTDGAAFFVSPRQSSVRRCTGASQRPCARWQWDVTSNELGRSATPTGSTSNALASASACRVAYASGKIAGPGPSPACAPAAAGPELLGRPVPVH